MISRTSYTVNKKDIKIEQMWFFRRKPAIEYHSYDVLCIGDNWRKNADSQIPRAVILEEKYYFPDIGHYLHEDVWNFYSLIRSCV